ncbi:MAG: hypothetical protein WBK46_12485 [Ruminococcus flavefaciens]
MSRACRAFRITRKTFYEWLKTDEHFRALIDEAREEIKDFAESQLLTLMKGIPKLDEQGRIIGWVSRPDTAAIIFFNKTRNKDRGYVERMEIRSREEPTINMERLTEEERQQLYRLIAKADTDDDTPCPC